MIPTITNICVSFHCTCKLDLQYIFSTEKEVQIRYNRKRFPGLIVRLQNTQTTALIFGSGYISTAGSKSLETARSSAEEVISFLKKYETNVIISNYKVNNICGSIEIHSLNIRKFVADNPRISSYEIELFPALKLNFESKIFTIHHNGKIFSTGFKSIDEMNVIFSKLCEKLLPYRKE